MITYHVDFLFSFLKNTVSSIGVSSSTGASDFRQFDYLSFNLLHVLINWLNGDKVALLLHEAGRTFFTCCHSAFSFVFCLPVPQQSYSIMPRQIGKLKIVTIYSFLFLSIAC